MIRQLLSYQNNIDEPQLSDLQSDKEKKKKHMNKNIRYTLGKNNRCHEVNLKMVKKKGGTTVGNEILPKK